MPRKKKSSDVLERVWKMYKDGLSETTIAATIDSNASQVINIIKEARRIHGVQDMILKYGLRGTPSNEDQK